MPKRKADPLFSHAATLTGVDRALYLAQGNFAAALDLVNDVKLLECRISNDQSAVPGPSGGDVDDEWQDSRAVSVAREREDLYFKLTEAILLNDPVFFRKIADVLEEHASREKLVVEKTDFGIIQHYDRKPSHALAAEIARWAYLQELRKAPLTFDALWTYLSGFKDMQQFKGTTAKRLKSAENTVRNIAGEIGVELDRVKPGPKRS